jgi:hypothetical protein
MAKISANFSPCQSLLSKTAFSAGRGYECRLRLTAQSGSKSVEANTRKLHFPVTREFRIPPILEPDGSKNSILPPRRRRSTMSFAGEVCLSKSFYLRIVFMEQAADAARRCNLARRGWTGCKNQSGRIHGNFRNSGKHRSRHCPAAAGARAVGRRSGSS